MANLNTRILLKNSTLAEWQSSVFNGDDSSKWLKKGELAIVTIGETKDGSTQVNDNKHPVLFKVGTGAHKFDDLPWASALAADVYAWAKENKIHVTKDGTGNVVSGIEWDATANGGKGGLKFTTAAVATAEGLGDLQEAVEAIQKDIADNRDDWATKTVDTNDNTTYAFAIVDGKLQVTETPHVLGVAGTPVVNSYDFVTPDELNTILAGYYTSGQIDTLVNGKLHTEDEIKTLAANEIGRLIDASGDAETLKSIGDLVDYAEKNAGDIAQLVTDVGTANTNASNAVATANGAATTAGQALEKANEALTGAEGAQNAKTAAEAAQAKAEEAQGKAEAAQGAAETAKGLAETAQGKAEDAQGAAETAQGLAEDAQEAAEAARDAAQDSASAAAGSAEAAAQSVIDAAAEVTKAQGFATTANNAKADAEAAKGAAENARDAAASSAGAALSSQEAAATSAGNAATSAGAAATAQGKAEDAQAAAEAAQAAAVAAKEAAEASNTSATAIANEAKELANTANGTANTAKETADDAKEVADATAEALTGKMDKLTSANGNNFLKAEVGEDGKLTGNIMDSGFSPSDFQPAGNYKLKQGAETFTGATSKTITSIAQNEDGALTVGFGDIAIAATQVSGLAAIATTGNVNDLVQTTGDYLIFDCGTATTVI